LAHDPVSCNRLERLALKSKFYGRVIKE